MNKSPWIFLGVIATLSLSWWGMVYGPAAQLGAQTPEMANGQPSAPTPLSGLAKQGEQVYRSNGCYYCHTRAADGGEFGYLLQIDALGPSRALTEDIIGSERMTPAIKLAYHILSTLNERDAQAAKQAIDGKATAAAEVDDNATKALAEAKAAKQAIDGNATAGVEAKNAITKAFEKARAAKLEADKNATAIAEAKDVATKDLIAAQADLVVTKASLDGLKLTSAEKYWAFQISGAASTNPIALKAANISQADANGTNPVEGLTKNVQSITAGTEQWADIATMVGRLGKEGGATYTLKLMAKKGAWPDVEYHKAARQSVARDYFFNAHGLSGVMRLGPDLSNIGNTMGSDEEMFVRLYNSRLVNLQTAKSAMPPYQFLFTSELLKEGESPPTDAVTQDGKSVKAGYAVFPTEKARALVAFLRSLRHEPLPEAPLVTK